MLWIVDEALVLSIVSLFVIAISPLTNRFVGAAATYKLWILLPVSLVITPLISLLGPMLYAELRKLPSIKATMYDVALQ